MHPQIDELNKYQVVWICLTLVVINAILDHEVAPLGIMLTPILLIGISGIITFSERLEKPLLKSCILSFLICLNDAWIRLYGGGTHDREGLAWIDLLLFVGLIPAYLIFLTGILRDKKASWRHKIAALLLMPFSLWIYLLYFHDLGLGRRY